MDGKIVAQKIKTKIKEQAGPLAASKIKPDLATILVGDNPGSKAYLGNIHKACAEVGFKSRNIELRGDTSQERLESVIRELNDDKSLTGVLLQLPLPKGLNEASAIASINAERDVDGLTPSNLGQLFQRNPKLVPCTPKGILVLLKYYRIGIAGKHAVIINRSRLLGRPLSQLLLNEDATVTVCHSKTQGLAQVAKEADILLTGIGHRSEFTVGGEIVKPGAVVVDIGTSSVEGKLMGDVDFDSAIKIASYVTPVPGGVGPMTNAMLLYNTLLAACSQAGVELKYNPEVALAEPP
jgi:methylenetetrahydrofolate dehydrogenase (NADP+)/methenyltetrahydrofolate cyclohydrolase